MLCFVCAAHARRRIPWALHEGSDAYYTIIKSLPVHEDLQQVRPEAFQWQISHWEDVPQKAMYVGQNRVKIRS